MSKQKLIDFHFVNACTVVVEAATDEEALAKFKKLTTAELTNDMHTEIGVVDDSIKVTDDE